jgi:hypothetical protein
LRPDGLSEELKEFTYAVGAEYSYQDSFAMRLGYFNESDLKGANFSLGAGFKYNVVKVDMSIYFQHKSKKSLENTLRFSLTFNFGDKYNEY